MMRYQTFARDELDRALQKHQVLLKAVGNVASIFCNIVVCSFQMGTGIYIGACICACTSATGANSRKSLLLAGEDAFSALSRQYKDFILTFAESLLAKEKLDAALR